MDIKTATEQELREMDTPRHETIEELTAYIKALEERQHDYGTCVYAMSMSAIATFNYIAAKLGVTGFQASCADLDVLRRSRGLKCPFMIVKADDMLYPQYNIVGTVQETLVSWAPWAAVKAKELLTDTKHASPNVIKHWENLATKKHHERSIHT